MEPGAKNVGRLSVPRVSKPVARLLWLLAYLRSRLLAEYDPQEAGLRRAIDRVSPPPRWARVTGWTLTLITRKRVTR